MTTIDCKWNHNGSVLAVAGKTQDQSNVVQFFTAYGEVRKYLNFSNIQVLLKTQLENTKRSWRFRRLLGTGVKSCVVQ